MRVAVEGPTEHAGGVLTTLMQRRGAIIGQQETGGMTITEAEVPLAEMFGYATTIRSATQGKADFTMEFSRYVPVPEAIELELVEKAMEKAGAGK
jgi:elongation factor G